MFQASLPYLTLLLFIHGTSAQVLLKGECPAPPTMPNFDPGKFLGTWYQLERFYSDYEANGECTKLDYSSTPDGRIGVISSALNSRTGLPMVSYGDASFVFGSFARMVVKFSPRHSSPTPQEFHYSVLDTDYSSYAVLFSCSDICHGNYHTESAWILGRAAAVSQETLQKIHIRLKMHDIDPSRFLKVNQDDCVNVSVSVRSDNPRDTVFGRERARTFLAGITDNFTRRMNRNVAASDKKSTRVSMRKALSKTKRGN